ncbi:uncharacterized protein LOC142358664 [Convolutriloba macropyga]|uniref:uncharacterized protein LOC142358664 n=1 Tax=Convolutriloba macropyga TaxID=536237 RepID=UPI003F525B1B
MKSSNDSNLKHFNGNTSNSLQQQTNSAGGNFNSNPNANTTNNNTHARNYNDYQDKMLSEETKQLMEMFNRMLITMHVTYKIDTKFYPRGGTYEIVVMHQPDANFLFGLIKTEDNKSKMMAIVQRLSSAPRNPISLSDTFCFALLDNSPCRAYIISRDAKKARLFFLDWGNIDHVDLGKCYKIKDEAMKICPLCMPFELRGCPCNTPPPVLNQPITLKAEVRCINGPRRTILVNAFYNEKPYTDLFNATEPSSLTMFENPGIGMINESDVASGDGPGVAGVTQDLDQLSVSSDFQLPDIEKGASVMIKIVSVITPSSFIFQTTDDYFQRVIRTSVHQLRQVVNKGQHQIAANNRETFINQTLKAGHTVIVHTDKILSRAHVLKVIPNVGAAAGGVNNGANNAGSNGTNRGNRNMTSANNVSADKSTMLEVILLETGEKCIITTDCVYPCPRDLRNIPGLFYKGCLNNIKPVGGLSWDARATRLFASMVENVELEAKIVHVGRLANKPVNVHFMDLFMLDKSNSNENSNNNNNNNSNVSVADILVNSKVSVAFRSS